MAKIYDLVIDATEGMIVDPTRKPIRRGCIGIAGESVEEISDGPLTGKRTISTKGYVFPGFIDGHVHLRDEEWYSKEDFVSGTRAAINGGVTTVADMPNVPRPVLTLEDVKRRKELAAKARCDVVFYGGVTERNLGELERMAPDICGYKIYVCESTGNLMLQPEKLYQALRRIESTGKPVTIHCEDQEMLEEMKRNLGGLEYPHVHCDLRPPAAEIAAIKDVLSVASGINVHVNIAHTSTAGGLKLVEEYQETHGRARVTCEVTPHHLHFTSHDMSMQGDMLKMNPPLRSEADRKALFEGLRDGAIHMLATDHAPHTREDKMSEKPSGVPNLDDYGRIVSGLIDDGIRLQRIAEVTSFNPAAYLGLPHRGRIQEGYVADLAIIEKRSIFAGLAAAEPDSSNEHKIYTKFGWSPYERERFPGVVTYTIHRGQIVKKDGKVMG